MKKKELTEQEKNKLWKDDKFCLYKELQDIQMQDARIQTDYAMSMGRSFFGG